jgi:hypothetical protein
MAEPHTSLDKPGPYALDYKGETISVGLTIFEGSLSKIAPNRVFDKAPPPFM